MDVAVEGGGEQAADDLAPDTTCDAEPADNDDDPPSEETQPPPAPAEPDPDPVGEGEPDPVENRLAKQGEDPENTAKNQINSNQEEEEEEEEQPSASSAPSPPQPPQLTSSGDPISEQEMYNSFHYWRTPIPEIDLDLELLEEQEEPPSSPGRVGSAHNSAPTLGRKELEEMIENLEPHIDDPDVKGQPLIMLIAVW